MQTTENKHRRPGLIAKKGNGPHSAASLRLGGPSFELRHDLVGAERLTYAQIHTQQVFAMAMRSVMMRRTI
jgi:hypothetical protein